MLNMKTLFVGRKTPTARWTLGNRQKHFYPHISTRTKPIFPNFMNFQTGELKILKKNITEKKTCSSCHAKSFALARSTALFSIIKIAVAVFAWNILQKLCLVKGSKCAFTLQFYVSKQTGHWIYVLCFLRQLSTSTSIWSSNKT